MERVIAQVNQELEPKLSQMGDVVSTRLQALLEKCFAKGSASGYAKCMSDTEDRITNEQRQFDHRMGFMMKKLDACLSTAKDDGKACQA